MFDREVNVIRGNYKIGQAINVARSELGIDIEHFLGRHFLRSSHPEAMVLRETLREMIDHAKCNEKEIALLICRLIIPRLSLEQRIPAGEKVMLWASLGVIRPQLAENILQDLMKGTVLDDLAGEAEQKDDMPSLVATEELARHMEEERRRYAEAYADYAAGDGECDNGEDEDDKASSVERPYLSGYAIAAAEFIVIGAGATVKKVMSGEDVSANDGLIASFVVNHDVVKSFDDLDAPPELMTMVSAFLLSKGRGDGTLPYRVGVFANIGQDNHTWLGIKSNEFVTVDSVAQGAELKETPG